MAGAVGRARFRLDRASLSAKKRIRVANARWRARTPAVVVILALNRILLALPRAARARTKMPSASNWPVPLATWQRGVLFYWEAAASMAPENTSARSCALCMFARSRAAEFARIREGLGRREAFVTTYRFPLALGSCQVYL